MPFDQDDRARICSIDPGSNTLGFAVIEFSVVSLQIYSTQACTYVGDRFQLNPYLVQVHGERIARIQAHHDNILQLLNYHQPLAVVCESSFYNIRRPMAFGALLEVLNAIRQALIEHNDNLKLDLVDPPTVKRAVGAPGNADKQAVQRAVLSLPDLNYNGPLSLDQLDEHAVDAIAVGYSKLKQYRGL